MAGQYGTYKQRDGKVFSKVNNVQAMWRVALNDWGFDEIACAKACLKEYGPEQMNSFLKQKGIDGI